MRLLLGDVLSFARHYKGEPFHALLCDAPYHLTSITERFGKEGSAEAQYGNDGAFQRASKGFMGKSWDGGDVSFRPETWEALGNLLYPGAFGMTFGGSRTAHRMAVAIEDAGFIIHPMIGWVYGSGFPKATRIDTQIDKEAGLEQEIVGKRTDGRYKYGFTEKAKRAMGDVVHAESQGFTGEMGLIKKPATPLAQSWEGHRYGLQALKPALEPIIVFQKPYEGRPIDSITKTGAGALNIDGGRIGTEELTYTGTFKRMIEKNINQGYRPETMRGSGNEEEKTVKGRWPANVTFTHSPDCQLIGHRNDSYQINRFTDGAKPFGDGAGHEFDSEEVESGTPVWDCVDGCPVKLLDGQSGVSKSVARPPRQCKNPQGVTFMIDKPTGQEHTDSGGASRFFHQSHYDPFFYQAKAGVRERNAGLKVRNPHPTVKPIGLTRHLATLLLPPEEYKPRRLLIPFAGTGSEIIGAFQAGWECVIGVELEKEYVDIGRARLKYWLEQGVQLELFNQCSS